MDKASFINPDYPPLGHDLVGRAAVDGQIILYPKVVRVNTDPPISNQSYGCLSFLLFKEPKTTKTGKPVYGFVKLRGNYSTEQQSKFEASKIIREIDSRYQIKITHVGEWVPITEDDTFIKDKLDVKTKEDEICLRDEAVKEKEAEQRRIQRELREREEELKSNDIYDDKTSLKYYSMRRVTELRLIEAIEKQKLQIQQLERTLDDVCVELYTSEKTHPEYIEEWVDCYNIERKKSGIPEYVPSESTINEHALLMKKISEKM